VDAELLLSFVTGRPRALLRMAGGPVPEDLAEQFAALIARRAERVPLQHLTGLAPFRHIEVRVGPGVFIPRPETELLVDAVLAHLGIRLGTAGHAIPGEPARGGPAPRGPGGQASGMTGDAHTPVVVDLCTGSAALAICVALEVPGSHVVAVELSGDALAWARSNVAEHSDAVHAAASHLQLVAADATTVADPGGPLAGLRGRVDVVVTNPPYVPEDAIPREPEVRDHDPALALYGGPDGLAVVRALARQAAALLRPGGLLLLEHADVQGEAAGSAGVPGLLREQLDPEAGPVSDLVDREAASRATAGPVAHAWRDVTDHRDLAGLPRFTSAIRAGDPRQASTTAPTDPAAPPGSPGDVEVPASDCLPAARPAPPGGRMSP
jgi:release factor glutamine methyltransferase